MELQVLCFLLTLLFALTVVLLYLGLRHKPEPVVEHAQLMEKPLGKMMIVSIGSRIGVDEDNGKIIVDQNEGVWEFDGQNINPETHAVIATAIGWNDSTEIYWGGYTAKELNRIHGLYRMGGYSLREINAIFATSPLKIVPYHL